jgi:hypothetical protein
MADVSGKKTGGRKKGTPNKTTALLKDAILQAGEAAGGKGGLVAYLTLQASENPGPFMSLLGKVLPSDMTNNGGAFVFPSNITLTAARDDRDD